MPDAFWISNPARYPSFVCRSLSSRNLGALASQLKLSCRKRRKENFALIIRLDSSFAFFLSFYFLQSPLLLLTIRRVRRDRENGVDWCRLNDWRTLGQVLPLLFCLIDWRICISVYIHVSSSIAEILCTLFSLLNDATFVSVNVLSFESSTGRILWTIFFQKFVCQINYENNFSRKNERDLGTRHDFLSSLNPFLCSLLGEIIFIIRPGITKLACYAERFLLTIEFVRLTGEKAWDQ